MKYVLENGNNKLCKKIVLVIYFVKGERTPQYAYFFMNARFLS